MIKNIPNKSYYHDTQVLYKSMSDLSLINLKCDICINI